MGVLQTAKNPACNCGVLQLKIGVFEHSFNHQFFEPKKGARFDCQGSRGTRSPLFYVHGNSVVFEFIEIGNL